MCKTIVLIVTLLLPAGALAQASYTATYSVQPSSSVGGTDTPIAITVHLTPAADGYLAVTASGPATWTNNECNTHCTTPVIVASAPFPYPHIWPAGTPSGEYVFYPAIVSRATTVTFSPMYFYPNGPYFGQYSLGTSYTLDIMPPRLLVNASPGVAGVHVEVSLLPPNRLTTPFELLSSDPSIVNGGTFAIPANGKASLDLPFGSHADPDSLVLTARIDTPTGYLQQGGTLVIPESGINLGTCDDQCEKVAGQPINLTNGNVFITQRDYLLPGLGGGITLERTWNSLWPLSSHANAPVARMFGHGWTSNFEERMVTVDANTVDYWRGDGSKWRFQVTARSGSLATYELIQPGARVEKAGLTFDSTRNQHTLNLIGRSTKVFDVAGYPVSVTDLNGNRTIFAYDQQRRLTSVSDAASRSLRFIYADSLNPNQVTAAQDSVGTIASYNYSSSGQLLQVTYSDGSYNRFNYDSAGLILSVTDSEGKILEAHTYDASRRGLTSERADGVDKITVSYDPNAVTTLTDSLGRSSQYPSAKINGRSVVTGVSGSGCSNCGGRGNQVFTYDSDGNRTSLTDALGNTARYQYDSAGNMIRRAITVTGSDVAWSFTYNSLNEVLTVTDPLGSTTTNTYDTRGNLLSTTTPAPGGRHASVSKTTFAYDTKGQLVTLTDPLRHTTKFTYTPAGLIETMTDALGKVTRFEYDARGNRTATVDPLGQRTTFVYDSRNRPTRRTFPTTPLSSTSFAYDSRGRRISIMDADGNTTRYSYDDADRLTAVIDAQTPPAITRYQYDSENNLLSITDALGRVTRYEYDDRGRVMRTNFPSNLSETYTYDLIGNLIGKTDRGNKTTFYTYDSLQRLTHKQYPDGVTTAYAYDATSRLRQISDPTGEYGFVYDSLGRLIEATTAYSFMPGKTFTVGYSWDEASNLASMTDPQNGDTAYAYDTLNRLVTLKTPQRDQFSFTYDPLGRRIQLSRPNGVDTNYQYDSLSHVTSLLHQLTTRKASVTLDGAEYSYDAMGYRQARADKLTNIVSNYAYDPTYQLTRVSQGTATTESYSYDAVGNRLSSLSVGTYTYNPSNQLIAEPGVTYSYDNEGNLISKTDASGTTRYTWDFENQLTQVVQPDGSQITFKYDPLGRRIQKASSSGVTNYIYDGLDILEELDAAGVLVARYTHNLGIDEPMAALKPGRNRKNTATTYYEADALGTITSVSDSSGALAAAYAYDSFGRPVATSSSVANPYRFTGRELDSETGLMYYRARYYDPNTGRFMGEDPIGLSGGINVYEYAKENPINNADPLGLCTKKKDKCLKQFYESNFGKLVELGSPLSVIPRWGANWKKSVGEWFLLGGGKVAAAETIQTVSRFLNPNTFTSIITGETITIPAFADAAVSLGLRATAKMLPFTWGTAAIVDVLAHAYCQSLDPDPNAWANIPD